MKIKIKDQEIELKQTFRTLMLYENATKQSFQNNGNLTNLILYFFCNILASCDNTDLTFDEFMDYLDNNNKVLTDYLAWLTSKNKINDIFSLKIDNKTEKKRVVKKDV